MTKLQPLSIKENPPLYEWLPETGEIYYEYTGENVKADYDGKVGKMDEISTLPIFYIKKNHYKARMDEIVHVLNYFTKFYDLDRETFFAMMITKYFCDTHTDIPQKEFINYLLTNVVTPSFVGKCKMMSCDLYKLNINSDSSGKFNNTPKITNQQAFQLVAVSFAFKILTPIMLHFSNINTNFNPAVKTEYLKWFNKLFNRVIKKFEEGDTPFYNSLCKFVAFRGEKANRNNTTAFYQKKMLRGDTLELYNDTLIKEVVCVKTLYKLDYRQSCVAFIDGVIHNFNMNYLKENFTSKPYEIDSEETSKDSDESLSHAEALEMAMYKRDESSAMVADINTDFVMNKIRKWYKAFDISQEEFDFYYNNFYPNEINQSLFNDFYAGKFKDPYAVANLNRVDTVYLLICMKKVFQAYKMYHLAQVCTAKVFKKYKENIIKNSKFMDEITSSSIYKEIISKKYSYILELGMKDNPLLKVLSSIINSTFTLVDFDKEIDGYQLEHIDREAIANEYLLFLSII